MSFNLISAMLAHRREAFALLVALLLLRAIDGGTPDPAIAALFAWVAERGGEVRMRAGGVLSSVKAP